MAAQVLVEQTSDRPGPTAPANAAQRPPAASSLRTLGTIRGQLVRRAGALIRPQGRLALTVAAPPVARAEFDDLLEHLQAA